jgi:hypothetical protein
MNKSCYKMFSPKLPFTKVNLFLFDAENKFEEN